MPIIETHRLRKTYPAYGKKNEQVEAVRGINLIVQEGEIFGFLGPNGAGKTTTLRMLTTLIPPTEGEARVVGFNLLKEALQIRQHIGYVSQTGGADPTATGRENLTLHAKLYGMTSSDANKRVVHLLKALELESFADRIVQTYSGGQRRRLDLALGMVHQPKLLFLDEPTTGLDPQSRARLWDELRALRAQGTSIFLTTHYLEEADILADRLAIMDHGEIVSLGTPLDLKQQIAGDVITLGLNTQNGTFGQIQKLLTEQPFVRELHPTGDNQIQLYVERGEESLPILLRIFDGANLQVQKVSLARPTLDDVFLRKTGRSLRDAAG